MRSLSIVPADRSVWLL